MSAFYAAQHARLLAATVEFVVDGWDPLADEPVMQAAVSAASEALTGLLPGAQPASTLEAMDRLNALVDELPARATDRTPSDEV